MVRGRGKLKGGSLRGGWHGDVGASTPRQVGEGQETELRVSQGRRGRDDAARRGAAMSTSRDALLAEKSDRVAATVA